MLNLYCLPTISQGFRINELNSEGMENHECLSGLIFTKDNVSPFQLKVIISVSCTLIPMIIIPNILLIYLLLKTKQLNLITNYFVLAMSISDTCTGGIFGPLALLYYGFLSFSQTMEIALFLLSTLLVHFSVLMVLAIAVDRYIHIYHLRSNKISLSPSKAKIIIAGSFTLSSGYAICVSWMLFNKNTKWLILGICIQGSIILFLIGLFYIRLYCRVRRLTAKVNVERASSRHRLPRHAIFLTKTVIIILLSLLCCFLPYLTINMIIFFHSESNCIDKTLVILFSVSVNLMYTFAAVNALIIIFRNRAIMSYIWAKLDPRENVTNTEKEFSTN